MAAAGLPDGVDAALPAADAGLGLGPPALGGGLGAPLALGTGGPLGGPLGATGGPLIEGLAATGPPMVVLRLASTDSFILPSILFLKAEPSVCLITDLLVANSD